MRTVKRTIWWACAVIAVGLGAGCVDAPDEEKEELPSSTYDPVWSPNPTTDTPVTWTPGGTPTPGATTPAYFPTPPLSDCVPEEEVPYDGVDQDCDGFDLDDVDGDGYVAEVAGGDDCDDENPDVHPGASEVPYDGVDQDCDGSDLVDQDHDGYPPPEAGGDDCDDLDPDVHPGGHEVPYDGVDQDCDGVDLDDLDGDGFVAVEAGGDDCDDGNPTVFPGAEEIPYDGIDQDCDGDDLSDLDQDGHAAQEAGGDDCDDLDPEIHPGAEEVCDHVDNDCDGLIDEGFDQDHDGHLVIEGCETQGGDDCDDTWGFTYPGAEELCDGRDNDCDGEVDEGFSDLDADGVADCLDDDKDGDGFIAVDDCDDTDPLTYPGAEELCDGIDNNCDGAVDETFPDLDQDGIPDCRDDDVDGDGYNGTDADGDDCDDFDPEVNPGADELCDGIDNDCDDLVDEDAVDQGTFYEDADGDGYGNPAGATLACSRPDGHVTNDSDCDDADAVTYPGADEVCDGKDNDCDGDVDEGVQSTFYLDGDGDGYGAGTETTEACAAPGGYVADGTDCDDGDAAVHPGAPEVCNERDDDCDGQVDEGVETPFYWDGDGDGFGNSNVMSLACTAPAGFVEDRTDCDDGDAAVHPGAPEVCNERDDDCDGQVDEGVQTLFYLDADGDGFGNGSLTILACSAPAGYVSDRTDCDDSDPITYPGADEVCDGKDNDCDGSIDEGVQSLFHADADGDGYGDPLVSTPGCTPPAGYVVDDSDCDDADFSVHPGAEEVCDQRDNDCDGEVDEGVTTTFYPDNDSDLFGDQNQPLERCEQPEGYVLDGTDCDDSDPAVNPAADEVLCNSIDDDCDGDIDEGMYYERIPGYRFEPTGPENGCVIEEADPPLDMVCSEGMCGGTCMAWSFVEYKAFPPPGGRYELRVRLADILHNCKDTLLASFYIDNLPVATFQGAGVNDWVMTDPVPFTSGSNTTIIKLREENDACCVCEGNCDASCDPLIPDLNMYIDYVEVRQVCP